MKNLIFFDSKNTQILSLLVAIFTSSLVTANMIGSKLIDIFGVTVSAGILIFPFTFLTADIITEIYGKEKAQETVKIGVFIQLYVLLFVYIGTLFPSSPKRDIGNAYEVMFALTPRMILASICAYSFSQLLDVKIFAKLKYVLKGKHLLLRTNLASWISQFFDTLIFMGIFLGGVIPFSAWVASFLTAYFTKMFVASFDSPVVNLVVSWIKKLEIPPQRYIKSTAVKTAVFGSTESLFDFLLNNLREINLEGKVLAVTSKIVSISEGKIISSKVITKNELVKKEADHYLGEGGYGVELTIKHGLLIPSAGIDESNSRHGDYILYPDNPYESAKKIGLFLKQKLNLQNFAVILTDSHTTPLRMGVTGISLAHWGIKPTESLVGKPDLFSKPLKFTHVNIVDSLASAAVYVMGESNNCTPLAIIECDGLEFESVSESEAKKDKISIDLEKDLYYPILKDYLK